MTDEMDLATAENFLEDGAQCKYCPHKTEDGGDCGRSCDSVVLSAARVVIAAREAERDEERREAAAMAQKWNGFFWGAEYNRRNYRKDGDALCLEIIRKKYGG